MKLRNFSVGATCAVVLGLQACGGGSGGNSFVSGQVLKGPVVGARVCAYTLTTPREQIACTTTDTTSSYKLNLPSGLGAVLIEADGGNYVDESTGLTTALIDPMRTVAQTDEHAANVLVTPFTELAVQKAIPAGMAVPFTFEAFQAQIIIVESALGTTGVSNGQPFGSDAEPDRMHRKALEAFSRQQSGSRTSVPAVVAALAAVMDDCGPSSVGAQLAVYGAAGLPRFGPRGGTVVTAGQPSRSPTTSPIDLAASGLSVLNNGCLVPTSSGTGFSQIRVFPVTSSTPIGEPSSGRTLGPAGVISWKSFSIGSDLSVKFVQPASHAVLNGSGGGSTPQVITGVLADTGPMTLANQTDMSSGGQSSVIVVEDSPPATAKPGP